MSRKITLYEYRNLPEQERYSIVFNEGIYLDFRFEGDYRYGLYAVDRFFVEVKYNDKNNEVEEKQAFIDGEVLDKYFLLNL